MAKFYKEAGEFRWEGTPQERFPAKEAGFRWDPNRKIWWTKDKQKARKLREHATGDLADYFKSMEKAEKANLEASRALYADLNVPTNPGLEHPPFQKAGIAWILARWATLLADEMGTGKTIQAIGAINADDSIERVLIICPAALRLNWKKELEKWLVRKFEIGVAYGKAYPEGASIVIINYDILQRYPDELRAQEWDLLIVDECHHYVKNPKAIRTKNILGHRTRAGIELRPIPAKRRLFMSGSPMVNRPIELWGIIHCLDPQTFGDFWGYARRYCDAHQNRFGWDMSGASNLSELQQKLRQSIMIRRLKRDVLTELPSKIRQVIELPTNGARKLVDAEKKAWAEREELLAELHAAVEMAEANDDDDAFKDAMEALNKAAAVSFSEMSSMRREVAEAKIELVVEHVKGILDGEKKVVVFAHHRSVLEAIRDAFKDEGAVLLYGGMSDKQQQAVVDRFQTDPSCKVFVGGIMAAGVGITLTASSNVVFAELDWVPGNVSQAEDRCHRMSQTEPVLVQHLVYDGSIDANMAHTVVEKQRNIEKAMDLKFEFADIAPTIPLTPAATKRRSPRKDSIEVIAKILDDHDRQLIEAAIQTLAGLCDSAYRPDGVGFNKIDSKIGKELAMSGLATLKQAALGFLISEKYQKQLGDNVVKYYGELRERVREAIKAMDQ